MNDLFIVQISNFIVLLSRWQGIPLRIDPVDQYRNEPGFGGDNCATVNRKRNLFKR
jgi:hypothetical protein